MSKEYELKVYWENCGTIKVKADSLEQAIRYAENSSLPEISEYVPDSFNVDIECAEEWNNETLPEEIRKNIVFGEY